MLRKKPDVRHYWGYKESNSQVRVTKGLTKKNTTTAKGITLLLPIHSEMSADILFAPVAV